LILPPHTRPKHRLRRLKAVDLAGSYPGAHRRCGREPPSLQPSTLKPDGNVHASSPDRERAPAGARDRPASGWRERRSTAGGHPFTVKDIFLRAGHTLYCASRMLATSSLPTPHAGGAHGSRRGIMLGKVNLDEYTYGSSSESSAFQPSRATPGIPAGCRAARRVAARRCGCRGRRSVAGHGHGRLHPPAGFLLRRGGDEATTARLALRIDRFGSSLDCPVLWHADVTDAALMLQVIAGVTARCTAANRAGA